MSGLVTYNHPVYGPDRQSAALSAINELAASRAPLTGWSDYDTPAMCARYVAARDNRELYSEYGSSYDEQADAQAGNVKELSR